LIGLCIMEAKTVLSKFLPASCVDKVHDWLKQHHAVLRITRARESKLGDYRPPQRGLPHRISVNNNLNPHEFLITLVHEMAHLLCWEKYGRRAKPHGQEWKLAYKDLLPQICDPAVFPEDIQQALTLYFHPRTSYRKGNEVLKQVLRKYDPASIFIAVEDISEGDRFLYHRRVFRKMHKVRKRFQCLCLNNNRLYSFSPLAQVLPEVAS
jgi:SprT protein